MDYIRLTVIAKRLWFFDNGNTNMSGFGSVEVSGNGLRGRWSLAGLPKRLK